MIVEIRAENVYSFEDKITFSMHADMRGRRLSSNVHRLKNINVLKSAGVFGANNAGKTCLVKCVKSIKSVILNEQRNKPRQNLFSNNPVCFLGVSFVNGDNEYVFDFSYNAESKEYEYEKFSQIIFSDSGDVKEDVWLLSDHKNKNYKSKDKELEKVLSLVSKNNLLIHLIDVEKFSFTEEMKRILTSFAENIDIVDMNNIPIQNTIDVMKNNNDLQKKVVKFIRQADLYMDNFEYVNKDSIKIKHDESRPQEDVLDLDIPEKVLDQMRLASTYKGHKVPSILYDSTGTKKIAALASYVIKALEDGRILVVDELDSSLHFKLTRAIVAMFNNDLNKMAQLIFTAHDISLMDVKRLFRKEQIWFVHKDAKGVYVYSLADFTTRDGVRETTDLIEKYKKGALGALPEPDMIQSLIDIADEKKGVVSDGTGNAGNKVR